MQRPCSRSIISTSVCVARGATCSPSRPPNAPFRSREDVSIALVGAPPPSPPPFVRRGKPQFSPSLGEFVDAAQRERHADPQAIARGIERARASARARGFHAPHAPQALARAIVADSVFAHPHPKATPAEPSLIDRVLTWIGDRLEAVFSGLRKAVNLNERQGALLEFVFVAAAALGTLALFVTLVKRRIEHRVLRALAQDERAASPRTREELVADARALAERGDYGRAIGVLFAAAIEMLDERDIVPYDAARTPGEYRRAVRRARSALADAFDVIARGFVLAVYGEDVPDELAWAGALAAYDRLSA